MSDIEPSHLQTEPVTGLSTKEATARQQRYGLNRIETKKQAG